MNIAVFASHNGSNLQAIIDAISNKELLASISIVISNNSNSGALKRCKEHKIPHIHLSSLSYPDFEELDNKTLSILISHNTDIIFLAGFMKKSLSSFSARMSKKGFETRPLILQPAATLYAWATGMPWEKVLTIAKMEEGDLAMLVTRTADNLRQIASLTKVYPAIARSALEAIAMILREPVAFD